MAKTVRVGMIGYGPLGKAHSNAWRQAPYFFPLKAKVELHTLCGTTPEAAQAARARLGWQFATTDWREVVESPLIDMVDISTAHVDQAQIALAAARAGKDVLWEQPQALNLREVAAVLAAAEKAKIIHMVCHNYRRVPAIAQAKRLIAEGALGELYHFHARYAEDWLVDPDAPLKATSARSTDLGGAQTELGTHLIDLGRFLVGEFKEVCGMLNTFIKERPLEAAGDHEPPPAKAPLKPGKVNVDDAAVLIGKFENGALANLEATRFAPGRKNHLCFEINGAKGSLCFDFEDMNRLKFFERASLPDRQGFRDILVLPPGEAPPHAGQWWGAGQLLGYEYTFVRSVADFVNACAERKPVSPSLEDGLKTQRVLAAAQESVKTRRWASVE